MSLAVEPSIVVAATSTTGWRAHRRWACSLLALLIAMGARCRSAHADTSFEISGTTGLGVLTAGVAPGRFALSPGVSAGIRGERWFISARDTVSLLGLTGGGFGVDNETTLGGGFFWKLVNVGAGLSLAQYSLPICGVQYCGKVRGFAPGANVRLDIFGPFLSGALGLSAECAGIWITGRASPLWDGISVRCSLGPIVRLMFQP
ncbi:MAG: hypothetical protein U0359_21650 [Byssovorax sp.]